MLKLLRGNCNPWLGGTIGGGRLRCLWAEAIALAFLRKRRSVRGSAVRHALRVFCCDTQRAALVFPRVRREQTVCGWCQAGWWPGLLIARNLHNLGLRRASQRRDAESQHEKQRSVLSMQARDRRPVSQRRRLRPDCAVYCLSANG